MNKKVSETSSDHLTCILGVRISPSDKERMKEEARKRGKTLSDLIWDLINAGWEKVVKETDVKQDGKSV